MTADGSDPKADGRVLGALKAWLPVVTVAAGGVWAVFVYFDGREPPAKAPAAAVSAATTPTVAAIPANPDVDKRKFAIFTEASQVASTLANTPVGTPAWASAEARFWQLYWGEMSIYEKGAVEDRMVKFGNALKAHKAAPSDDTAGDLQLASLRLGRALRDELSP